MQIDPNQSLELQLLVSIPVKQVEMNIGAEKLDASLLTKEPPMVEGEFRPRILRMPQALFASPHSNDALQFLIRNLNGLEC